MNFSRGSILLSLILTLTLPTLIGACSPVQAEPEDEASRLADLLDLKPGTRLADVGAGDGEWSEKLLPFVEPDGHLYATEVDEDELDAIRSRIDRAKLQNITPVLGDQDTTGLAPACCDAILLRMVYHHFTGPEQMRADLRRALHPRGRIVIVDIEPQKDWRKLPGTPDRGGHGIPMKSLIEEMVGDGFSLVSKHEHWNGDEDRYCVVFSR